MRGANCTSIDALIYAMRGSERVVILIEWKYTESYGNTNKADGDGGNTRVKRYSDIINRSGQLKNGDHRVYYFEPFYQLMRQTLWAECLRENKDTETVKADDFIHVVVIPRENTKLRNKLYPCSGMDMESTWRAQINNGSKFSVISPRDLIAGLDKSNYGDLIGYLSRRYWQ